MDMLKKPKVIAMIVGVILAIAGALLGADLKGMVCGGEAPVAVESK